MHHQVTWDKTYATFERTSIDVITVELADGHGGILVCVHLHESKATVGLETGLHNIAEVLKERDEIVLGGVGSEVADIASGLPAWSLLDDHIVALYAMSGEMMVAVWSGGCHAHGSHGLLLSDRRLSFLIGPVAADRARAKPFAVHSTQRLFSFTTLTEGNEAVATGATSLHVPHDASLGNASEGRESLEQDFIVYLVREIAHKDVEVIRGIFFAGIVGLVGPVDTDFLRGV